MARLFTSGAEFQSTTADHEIDSTSGSTITADTTTKRGGAASWKFAASASAPFLTRQYTSANGDSYVRAYINVTSLTTASSISIILIRDATNGNNLDIRLTRQSGSTYTLILNNEQTSTQIGSTSSTLNTNTWYRLEFSYIRSTGAANAYIDGQQFATGTANTTLNSNTLRWGSIDSSTMTIYFDDIAVNDSTGTKQNGLPGAGHVIRLNPNAAGDANSFGTRTGGTAGATNNYTRVNQTTPDDATTFNGSSTLNQEDLFNVTDSGLTSADIINVVEVWGRYRNSTADATAAIKFEIEKTASGTKSQSAAIVPNSTTWRTNAAAVPKTPPLVTYQDPDASNWTNSTLDSMQIGYKLTTGPGTAGRRIDVTVVTAVVDYLAYNPITATGIAATSALGSPTVTPGAVNISPSAITSGATIGSPTVSNAAATQNISPTGIASTAALGTAASSSTYAISTTGISATSSLGSPTASPGAVNISTTGISSGSALGVPTSSSTYNLTATGISATSALGSPTLSPGAVSITPTGISSTASIGSATSGSVYNVSTASISVTTAIGSPTASPGAVSIPETSITSTATIGAPTASPGAVNISPTAVSSGSALGSPTVSAPAGNQTITPSALATTLAIGSVALSSTFSLSVTSIASSAALGSPSIASVYSISATGLSSTSGLGSPTASPGVVSLSPSSLGPNTQFGAATLSGGTPVVQDKLAKLVDGGVTARVANVSQKVIVTGDGGLAVRVGNRYLQL